MGEGESSIPWILGAKKRGNQGGGGEGDRGIGRSSEEARERKFRCRREEGRKESWREKEKLVFGFWFEEERTQDGSRHLAGKEKWPILANWKLSFPVVR